MGRGPIPMRRPKLPFHLAITARSTFGISPSFLGLSQSSGQVTHVLLTRSRLCPRPKPGSSLHLHVLSTPPAFVLSQDQTLREELLASCRATRQNGPQATRLTKSRQRPIWRRREPAAEELSYTVSSGARDGVGLGTAEQSTLERFNVRRSSNLDTPSRPRVGRGCTCC